MKIKDLLVLYVILHLTVAFCLLVTAKFTIGNLLIVVNSIVLFIVAVELIYKFIVKPLLDYWPKRK